MATTAMQASTPPPPSSLRTPTTPRFGLDDNYQPYSPRKSARVSQRSREAKTPPPQSSSLRNSHTRSPRSSTKSSPVNLTISPSSPQTASKKRVARPSAAQMGGRRVSGALTYDSAASAAESLGLPAPKSASKASHRPTNTTVRNNGMLPTPAKTPVKRPSEIATAVTGVARNLFATHPDDEIMPSPKKKGRKKYSGLTMDSFEVEEDSAPIQIFTDSNDRVPEVDNSAENPFYGESSMATSEPTKRSSKRRKISVSGGAKQTVEELERREDGLVYVFRGKKIFRKFADEDEDSEGQDEVDGDMDAQIAESVPANLRRPLTRSSIKPRLLFPTAQRATGQDIKSHNTEDEEADTDIEDPNTVTPAPELALTPKAPKFAPASPPTTVRATRSRKIEIDSSPIDPTSEDDAMVTSPMHRKGSGKVSPFNEWQRSKAKPEKGTRKREGEPINRRGGEKKVRA